MRSDVLRYLMRGVHAQFEDVTNLSRRHSASTPRRHVHWRDGCNSMFADSPQQELPVSKKSHQLRGKVLAFNISPKGGIEGVLLETAAGTAQLNFPKHAAAAMAKPRRVGAKIHVGAEPEPEEGDHPVYRARDEVDVVSGTIVRLNHALHGEVNGCHLDDGTFVHLKPDGARKEKIRSGDKIKATGARRRGADAVVLEAKSLDKIVRRSRNGARSA